jgi:hypothetical protein
VDLAGVVRELAVAASGRRTVTPLAVASQVPTGAIATPMTSLR